jgi:hypothetical protein
LEVTLCLFKYPTAMVPVWLVIASASEAIQEYLRGKRDWIASELTLLAVTATVSSLSSELLLDKGRHETRHRIGEIAGAAHQMDRSKFGLLLSGEIRFDPRAELLARHSDMQQSHHRN